MASDVVFITVTDLTTINRQASFITSSTLKSSLASAIQTLSSVLTSAQASTGATASTTTAISSSPSGSPTLLPTPLPKEGTLKLPKNNTLAALVLAFIIILTVLFLGLLGFILYAKYKGRCHGCDDLKSQIKKLQKGDPITYAMVRHRESLMEEQDPEKQPSKAETQESVPTTQRHRETGVIPIVGPAYGNKKLTGSRSHLKPRVSPSSSFYTSTTGGRKLGPERNRGAALENLEGRGTWCNVDDEAQNRDFEKRRASFEQRVRTRQQIPDVDRNSQSTWRTNPRYEYHPHAEPSAHGNNPYAWSAEASGDLSDRSFKTYSAYFENAQSNSGSTPQSTYHPHKMNQIPNDDLAEMYRRACYEASLSDNPRRAEARKTVDHLRDQIGSRRRSQCYGGLTPLSRDEYLQDVDLGGQRGEGEAQGWTSKAKVFFVGN